jgi:hypothetical protein
VQVGINANGVSTGVGTTFTTEDPGQLRLNEPSTTPVAAVGFSRELGPGTTYYVETRHGGSRAISTVRTTGWSGPIRRVLDADEFLESFVTQPSLYVGFGPTVTGGDRLEEVFVDSVPFAPPDDLVFFDSFSRDDAPAGNAEYPLVPSTVFTGAGHSVVGGVLRSTNGLTAHGGWDLGATVSPRTPSTTR